MSESIGSAAAADSFASQFPPIKSLTKGERRVLGVLIEKGMTTPDQYPLTLKAATSGCNQKNNREPLTNYDEDQVEDLLEKLRNRGLVAEVHTEGGRTSRYRHYVRKMLTLSEQQVAILAELLLRGRQQLGDLRTRAGRMKPIDTQEQLRIELKGLLDLKLIQSDGPLHRRGAEVDHNWYEPQEGRAMSFRASDPDEDAPPVRSSSAAAHEPAPAAPRAVLPASGSSSASSVADPSDSAAARSSQWERQVSELQSQLQAQQLELQTLREELSRLTDEFRAFRSAIGG